MGQNNSEIVGTCQKKCNLSKKHCGFSRVWQGLVGFSGVWYFDALPGPYFRLGWAVV